jgi:hypothetical protein
MNANCRAALAVQEQQFKIPLGIEMDNDSDEDFVLEEEVDSNVAEHDEDDADLVAEKEEEENADTHSDHTPRNDTACGFQLGVIYCLSMLRACST